MRQGDPVSPYLFVIAMEYFLQIAHSAGSGKGIQIPLKVQDSKSAILMKNIFDQFSAASGLEANLSKSSIFCGVREEVQNELLSELRIPVGNLSVRYLGVPLISTRLNARDCQPLIERVRNKLQGWTTKYLSFAAEICNLAIECILEHGISTSSIGYQGNRNVNRFLWSGKISSKAIPMVAWEYVCLIKGEGGLGLRQLGEWNESAPCKYLWRIVDLMQNDE